MSKSGIFLNMRWANSCMSVKEKQHLARLVISSTIGSRIPIGGMEGGKAVRAGIGG
jgi:hypothetical protein